MRWIALGLVCIPLAACSSTAPEILIEVDADPALISLLGAVGIDVEDAAGHTDNLDVPLNREPPGCLPFSIILVAESAEVGDRIEVHVTANPRGGAPIDIGVDFPLQDGVRVLDVRLPGRCSDPMADCRLTDSRSELVEISREEAARRATAVACQVPVTPGDCLAGGGCYVDERSDVCETPCPESTMPDPPVAPMTPNAPRRPVVDTWLRDPFEACPVGRAHFPGEIGCVGIGAACPPGEFAAKLPPGTRAYVDPNATGPADGSEGAPDRTVAAALARGTDVVVLAKGTHPSAGVTIDRRIAIVGACAEQTDLAAPVTVSGPEVFLAGFAADGLSVTGAATVDGMFFDGPVSVRGGVLVARDLAIRSAGLVVELDGTVNATRVVVDGAPVVAVSAMGDARLDLSDAALLRGAAGLSIGGSATASIATTIVETMTALGVEVTQDARLVVRGSMIRDGAAGGLRVAGGSLALDRVTITDVEEVALAVDAPAVAVLRDVDASGVTTAAGTALTADALLVRERRIGFGGGVEVRDLTAEEGLTIGGVATIARVHVDRQTDRALLVTAAADATLTDVDIGGGGERSGVGLEVESGGVLRLTRARVVSARSAGVRVLTNTATAATVTIDDLIVTDTRAGTRSDGLGLVIGRGDANIDDHLAATLTMNRARFERNIGAGIGLSRSVANVFDVLVRGTAARQLPTAQFGGYGIVVTNGATLIADRVELLQNADAGVYAGILEGSTALECSATLINARIVGTTCNAEAGGCQYFRGSGAGVSQAGRLSLRRFLLKGNQYSGLLQFFVGEVDLFDGTIADHPIGVDIAGGYDTSRLVRRVRYENNEENIFSIGP